MKYTSRSPVSLLLAAGARLAGCAGLDAGGSDPLDGTSRVLIQLGGDPPLTGRTITVAFDDGRVRCSGGCNQYGGPYQVDGDRIAVAELAWTLMACAEPSLMEQEARWMGFLGSVRSLQLGEGTLQLVGPEGVEATLAPYQAPRRVLTGVLT